MQFEERIHALYEEIDELLKKQQEADEQLEDEIESKMIELRSLQQRAAEQMRVAFEERLEMPIDAGREAIEKADELLKRHGGDSSED